MNAAALILVIAATASPGGGSPIATPLPQATPLPSPAATAPATIAPSASSTPAPATPTVAPTQAPTATPVPTPAYPADVAVVWHISAAVSADASVRAAAIALSAPDSLGSIVRALRAHPRAHFSLAMDAGALNGLARAAGGDSALQMMAAGRLIGGARADMMRVLAQVPALDPSMSATPAVRRYRALAATAPLALSGRGSALSQADSVELAGFGALIRLAAADELGTNAPLLQKSALTDAEAAAVVNALAAADRKTLDGVREVAASGQLELIADPAGEPILPLLIDGGGKSGANIVLVGAGADAAMLVDQALRTVNALATAAPPGVYSPHGAYDDQAAAMLEQHRASFALFSDRVLRTSPIGGSSAAVHAADAGPYHAYALHATSGSALPVLFWSEDDSSALSVLSPGLPQGAMGARVTDLASVAGARGGAGSIVVLRIDAEGLWARRPDRARVIDLLAAALSSSRLTSVAIGPYLRAHPPSLSSYGFAPAADEGGLTYWMGTFNQAKMWTALGDARKVAGGDNALAREATRTALFESEASHWYVTPNLIAPQSEIDRLMEDFRVLIGRIYQTSGKSPPPNIAPLSPEPGAATPKPRS
ncbi:MAG: hypothetical protein JO293_08385 [Candidatus Eremiobacteraeota bacterium]|nr:hypothetical protein [Candidatus Eremiobacteraeota bacterium]